MKNTTINEVDQFLQQAERHETQVFWFSRIALVTLLFVLNTCYTYSQSQYRSIVRKEVGAELITSSNGHGLFYAPTAGIYFAGNHISASALFQQRTGNISGGRIAHSLNLSTRQHTYMFNDFSNTTPEILQLNWFTFAQFIYDSPLSSRAAAWEQKIGHNEGTAARNATYSTVEAGTGIELRMNFSNRICWRSSLGAAFYQNIGAMHCRDHEQSAVTINLSTALLFTIL